MSKPNAYARRHIAHCIAIVSASAALAAPSLAEERILEVVEVTAQKRSENLQDVPISISAVTAESISDMGLDNIDDMATFTAGVTSTNNSVIQAGYAIRGINTDSFVSGTDPSTAVYVDGVYSSRGGSSLVNFADVERVEVLRGPQGTLFGRNAASGAIHIITKSPSADDEGSIKLTVGSDNKQKVEGMYNTAISDNLYFRGSFGVNHRDGILDSNQGADQRQEDDNNVRAALLWNASADTEVLLRMEYSEVDQGGPNAITDNPTLGTGDYFDAASLDTKTFEERDLFGTSLEINHDMGNMSFTSITSYRTFNTINREDEDGSNSDYFFADSDNIEEQEQFSQEFRLTGGDEKFKWTTGLTYFKEDLEQSHIIRFNTLTLESFALQEIAKTLSDAGLAPGFDSILNNLTTVDFINGSPSAALARGTWDAVISATPLSPLLGTYDIGDGLGFFLSNSAADLGINAPFGVYVPPTHVSADNIWAEQTDNELEFESWAIYGDATYALNDQTNLTVGGRYTRDKKDYTLFSQVQNTFGLNPATGFTPLPDFGFAFQPGDLSDSESWTNFSARIVLDHQLNDNVMLYASAAEGFKSGGFNSFIVSGGMAPFDEETVTNYEIGMKSRWLDNKIQLNASIFSYEYEDQQSLELSSKLYAGQPIPAYTVRNADTEGQGLEIEAAWLINESWLIAGNYSYLDTEYTEYQLFPEETAADDAKGKTVSSSPIADESWNLFVQYQQPLSDLGTLKANVNYSYTGDRVKQEGTSSERNFDDHEIVNTRVALISEALDWEVALWANNLFDEEWILNIGGTGEAIGSAAVDRAATRTYGVDFIYNF